MLSSLSVASTSIFDISSFEPSSDEVSSVVVSVVSVADVSSNVGISLSGRSVVASCPSEGSVLFVVASSAP